MSYKISLESAVALTENGSDSFGWLLSIAMLPHSSLPTGSLLLAIIQKIFFFFDSGWKRSLCVVNACCLSFTWEMKASRLCSVSEICCLAWIPMKKIPAIKKITVMMSRITDGVILFFIKNPFLYYRCKQIKWKLLFFIISRDVLKCNNKDFVK